MSNQAVQQIALDKGTQGTLVTATSSGLAWMDSLSYWLDIAAVLVAITAGVLTVVWHIYNFRKARRAEKESSSQV